MANYKNSDLYLNTVLCSIDIHLLLKILEHYNDIDTFNSVLEKALKKNISTLAESPKYLHFQKALGKERLSAILDFDKQVENLTKTEDDLGEAKEIVRAISVSPIFAEIDKSYVHDNSLVEKFKQELNIKGDSYLDKIFELAKFRLDNGEYIKAGEIFLIFRKLTNTHPHLLKSLYCELVTYIYGDKSYITEILAKIMALLPSLSQNTESLQDNHSSTSDMGVDSLSHLNKDLTKLSSSISKTSTLSSSDLSTSSGDKGPVDTQVYAIDCYFNFINWCMISFYYEETESPAYLVDLLYYNPSVKSIIQVFYPHIFGYLFVLLISSGADLRQILKLKDDVSSRINYQSSISPKQLDVLKNTVSKSSVFKKLNELKSDGTSYEPKWIPFGEQYEDEWKNDVFVVTLLELFEKFNISDCNSIIKDCLVSINQNYFTNQFLFDFYTNIYIIVFNMKCKMFGSVNMDQFKSQMCENYAIFGDLGLPFDTFFEKLSKENFTTNVKYINNPKNNCFTMNVNEVSKINQLQVLFGELFENGFRHRSE